MIRLFVALSLLAAAPAWAQQTIKIGLVTALSGQSARAGEAITRGVQVAIDEINASGGVRIGSQSRKLELLRRDDESIPAKGVIAARELYFKEKVAVLIGGLDSPVALAIVPIANENKLPFMDPWAAGTPITKNGAKDNYVFRVSAVDELVDKAMLQYAQKTYNARKPGMILVNNPWGESNENKLPFMDPWAAGTPITKNGAKENYVFRVSAVDELVDKAMLQYAQKTYNARKPGMILVNNPWGESNEKGLTAALAEKKMQAAGIEKFEGNDVDVVPQLSRLKSAGTDVLFLVGNVGPSSQVVKSLDRMGWMPPIVSHWGPAGGRFTELAGPSAKNVHFVQTYSFFGNQSPVGQKVLKALMAKYPDIKGAGDVTPAVGVANAYDAMMLSALAIQNAGSTDGRKVRDGYYKIGKYEGLIKTYDKPFTPDNHDALNENDYVWAQFIDNQILPVGMHK